MPNFPFGKSVDPRDIRGELRAHEVRVNVWEGRTGQQGGTCTTYAIPVTELQAVLAWIDANPKSDVEIGLVAVIGNVPYLIGVDRKPPDVPS